MRGLQLDQLQQGATYGGGSIAGIKESIAHQGHKQLQLLRQLLLHILANAGQNIEQALNLDGEIKRESLVWGLRRV